jgi:hypothetical protein
VKLRRILKWITPKESKRSKDTASFPFHEIQELQALWEITVKRNDWDQKRKLWN